MPIVETSSSPSPRETPQPSSSPPSPTGLPPEPAGPTTSRATPGASTDARALKSKSLAELKQLAKAAGVTGYSRKKKTQLVRELSKGSSSPRRSVTVEKERPAPRVAPPTDKPIAEVTKITAEQVKSKLTFAGDITHGLGISYFGLDTPEAKKVLSNELTRDLFRFTDAELDAISPALASLANRHQVVSRIVEQSDEGVIALVVARSAVRNYTDLRASAAILEAHAPLPDIPRPPKGGDDRLDPEAQDVPREHGAGTGA